MEYKSIKPFIGKYVKIFAKEYSYKGVLTNVVSEFDTSSGEEEIELLINAGTDKYYEDIPFSHIKKIELA